MAAVTTWNLTTATTQGLVNSNGYIADNAGTVTYQLPSSSVRGDMIAVTGINNNTGWKIAQNAGQQIFLYEKGTTVGTSGSLQSTQTRDAIMLVCVTPGTSSVWNTISSGGNITVV